MFERLRENGPVVLVPAAWVVAGAAHADAVDRHTLLVAHVAMDLVLFAFAALSYREMRTGVLRVWLAVLLVGLPATLVGTYGLLEPPVEAAVVAPTLYAWMLVPAAGLAYTGGSVPDDEGAWVYLAGGAVAVLGACVYAAAPAVEATSAVRLLGLGLVGAGQTAGIANAVARY